VSFGKIKLDPADIAFSQWIRLRDMKCMRCGSPVQLNAKGLPITHQASHFQGRRKEGTRFEPLNVDTMCSGCHSYLGANPAEHYACHVEHKGQEIVDALVLQSNMYHKKDRQAEKLYWRQKLKELASAY
jgi:hypothetical protein